MKISTVRRAPGLPARPCPQRRDGEHPGGGNPGTAGPRLRQADTTGWRGGRGRADPPHDRLDGRAGGSVGSAARLRVDRAWFHQALCLCVCVASVPVQPVAQRCGAVVYGFAWLVQTLGLRDPRIFCQTNSKICRAAMEKIDGVPDVCNFPPVRFACFCIDPVQH